MRQFLKRLVTVLTTKDSFETNNYFYTLSLLAVRVNLYVIDLHLYIPYWVSVESRAKRIARIEALISELNFKFRQAEKAVAKKKKDAAKKSAEKKSATKKPVTKKPVKKK